MGLKYCNTTQAPHWKPAQLPVRRNIVVYTLDTLCAMCVHMRQPINLQ